MLETNKISSYKTEYINDLTAFGWQKTETVSERHSRHHRHYQIMARDTAMPNYDQLKKLEDEYESAKSKMQTYSPAEGLTVFMLLLLFIIPGVIYLNFKANQKNAVDENNKKCRQQMQECVKKGFEIQK